PRLEPERREEARVRLEAAGRDPSRPLVCLNPAGGWPTKQWPLARFVELGRRLAREDGCRLLALGEARNERLASLVRELGPAVLDLTGATSPGAALAAISFASLVVSEDSGLMHL